MSIISCDEAKNILIQTAILEANSLIGSTISASDLFLNQIVFYAPRGGLCPSGVNTLVNQVVTQTIARVEQINLDASTNITLISQLPCCS